MALFIMPQRRATQIPSNATGSQNMAFPWNGLLVNHNKECILKQFTLRVKLESINLIKNARKECEIMGKKGKRTQLHWWG